MLTEKQQKVMAALLSSNTRDEAAQKAGVSTRTIRNYLSQPEFKREYLKRCSEMIQDATRASQRGLSHAINVLCEMVQSDDTPANVKLQAARVIIDTASKLTELNDLQERVEAVENEVFK